MTSSTREPGAPLAPEPPVSPHHASAPETPALLDTAPSHSAAPGETAQGDAVLLSVFGEKSDEPRAVERKDRNRRMREILEIVSHYNVVRGLTPQQFGQLLEELGPTFVKAGQILSMRSELLPEAFRRELERLRTDVEPLPYATVVATLEEEYACPLAEVFEHIDPVPLGSASVAQVHRATLLTGEDVAVKVQRPGVRETMRQDIEILRQVVKRVTPFIGGDQVLDLQSVVNELWESFQEETNFLAEAHNLELFRENNEDVAYVTCPRPYMRWCTPHVVVMDYVSGISIAQPRALTAAGYDLQEIGERLVDNYAKQVLDDGYFHADPHPGNIIIAGGKIAFIDLGMMGRLSSTYRHILRQMVMAVAAHNSSALKDGLLRLSEHRDYDDLDHSALLFDLDEIVETYGAASLDELDLSAFLTSLMALARRYDIELPGAMTMIARGMVTLEGVLNEFLPGISMIEIIKRHIRTTTPVASVARDELTTFARETHGALHGTLQALSEAGLAAKMLTRGQLKLNLDVAGSQDPIEDLSHIADRLSMAVIIAGLLIGSSIVYFAGDSPGIFGIPYLGFLGYLIAIVLALVVVRDVLKRRHHH